MINLSNGLLYFEVKLLKEKKFVDNNLINHKIEID
jgi:hypothetical protein